MCQHQESPQNGEVEGSKKTTIYGHQSHQTGIMCKFSCILGNLAETFTIVSWLLHVFFFVTTSALNNSVMSQSQNDEENDESYRAN